MNSTAIPLAKSEFAPRGRLCIQTFDPRAEESFRDKPPIITKAAQNRILRDIVQNLQRLGFNACALQTSLLSDPKIFSLCFSYAVGRIDPYLKLSKRWDDEMIRVLKYFRYPFNLKRNDLFDLSNGSSWPLVLNSLHFLVSLAVYSSGFEISSDLFEVYDPQMEVIAKCKWDFILESLNPNSREQALNNLDLALKNIESGFPSELNLSSKENELNEMKIKISVLENKKVEGEDLDNRITFLNSQINKIEERSKDMTNLITIFKEKSLSLQKDIDFEINRKQKLKQQLSETTNLVNDQAIDPASVKLLNHQMHVSKERILKLTQDCQNLKEKQSQVETKLRQTNFQIQDHLSSLATKMRCLSGGMEIGDEKICLLDNFDFGITNWRNETTAFNFKDLIRKVKDQLHEAINKQLVLSSSLEKENCEKKVDLIEMNDLKQDLMSKVAEVDNQFKISEKHVKGMLSDALVHSEDSILRLSNEKWGLKKEISNIESEIIVLESKLNAKINLKRVNSEEISRQQNLVISQLYDKIKKSQEILITEIQKADIFKNNLEEYLVTVDDDPQ